MVRWWMLGGALLVSPAILAQTASPEAGLTRQIGGFTLQLPVLVEARVDGVGPYPVDATGTRMPAGADFSPLARIGLRANSGLTWSSVNLLAEYEQDLITGTQPWHSVPEGLGMPDESRLTPDLRKAYVRAIVLRSFVAEAGLVTNHWGLGLVANDGAHGWEPGSALFTDPRGGDRDVRGMLASVPFTKARLVAAAGYDRVYADDALITSSEMPAGSTTPGDRANQLFAAVTAGYDGPSNGGVYVVRRWQYTGDGRSLLATIVDATGQTDVALGARARLHLAAEGAYIGGTTTLAPAPGFPTQQVTQLGGVVRAGLDLGSLGAVLDVVYASGDPSLDGSTQDAFKANPNFTEGLLLFGQVLAGQTGRAPVTAVNPNLEGYTPTGLDRYPTRGAVTNTLSFFPRAWWRPMERLEIYGGPLLALAAASIVDPYNSFLAGSFRNSLNGVPGSYLGTELDAGARYRVTLRGTTLGVGIEGGLLFPGSAFNSSDGHPMGSVAGGRVMIDYRL